MRQISGTDEAQPQGRERPEQPIALEPEAVEVFRDEITEIMTMAKRPGLYANIAAKRRRIKAGSGERMRKPGTKGAPTAKAFRQAAKTAKGKKKK